MVTAHGLCTRVWEQGRDRPSALPTGLCFSIYQIKCLGELGEQMRGWALPMVSRMWTGWSSTAGGPAPARLTAATRSKNLSPRARFRMVCWVTIMGRAFTGTHCKAAERRGHRALAVWPWALCSRVI